MFCEKILKIVPALVFLFCLLELFELSLIVGIMNKTEKLENDLQNNLQVVRTTANSLEQHLEHIQRKSSLK